MELTITLGEQTFPGQLPILPTRFRLYNARNEAMGADWEDGADSPTFHNPDEDALAVICCAALGACWQGEERPFPLLREVGGKIDRFGDAVLTGLIEAGHDPEVVLREGNRLLGEIVKSIPRVRAPAGADPTPAPGASSTATSSSSD